MKSGWVQGLPERLLDTDPVSGIKTYFSSSEQGDGTWQFRHEFADVAPEVDASKHLQANDDHWKDGVKKEFVHYAHVPDAILFQWHCMGINIRDTEELIKMVNRREWRYLKCVDKLVT